MKLSEIIKDLEVLSATADMDTEIGGVSYDSRRTEPGDLFVAYRGEKVDGHEYIPAALDKGAACCLAERVPEGETRGVIVADDVQRALEDIAAAYRDTLSLPIVGITGSVSMSGSREMITPQACTPGWRMEPSRCAARSIRAWTVGSGELNASTSPCE